jgi:hypothetical protein
VASNIRQAPTSWGDAALITLAVRPGGTIVSSVAKKLADSGVYTVTFTAPTTSGDYSLDILVSDKEINGGQPTALTVLPGDVTNVFETGVDDVTRLQLPANPRVGDISITVFGRALSCPINPEP